MIKVLSSSDFQSRAITSFILNVATLNCPKDQLQIGNPKILIRF